MLPLGRDAAVRPPRSPSAVAANERGKRSYTGYHDKGEITHDDK